MTNNERQLQNEMAAFLSGYRFCRNCGEFGVDEDPCWRCGYDYETGEIVEMGEATDATL